MKKSIFVRLFNTLLCSHLLLLGSCGMELSIPHKPVFDTDIDSLSSQGFVHVGADNIKEMQEMKRLSGRCKNKQNTCGLDAGTSAGFMLSPREAFYDLKNPPAYLFPGDKNSDYDKLANEYPIMRSKKFPDADVGALPNTLAAFWSKQFKHHKAEHIGFDDFSSLSEKAKSEITQGRPVLIQVRIAPKGLPVFMPDNHLGIRTFWNAHWIVLLGYSESGKGEWLVRDNYGLDGTVQYTAQESSPLIRISNASLKRIADTASLADDLKTYLTDPDLPIFLDDWHDANHQDQLRKDFETMRAFNLVAFANKI